MAPRGPTSRFELKLNWEFPTYQEKVTAPDGRTTAVQARRALSAQETFAYIAGEDHRPLLVLRECLKCNGTDNALLTKGADNERTLLMSRWFHCIKLPPDVLAEDHPFHALFADAKPGHLFISRWDGTEREDLTIADQESRGGLWKLMESFLAMEYEKNAEGSIKQLLGILGQYDKIDEEIGSVKDKIDELIEAGQAESTKMQKLQDKLAELDVAKTKARAEAVRVSELKLRERKSKKTADVQPADGSKKG